MSQENVNKIVKLLNDKAKPYLIYIFGSSVNGIYRENSDIDISMLYALLSKFGDEISKRKLSEVIL